MSCSSSEIDMSLMARPPRQQAQLASGWWHRMEASGPAATREWSGRRHVVAAVFVVMDCMQEEELIWCCIDEDDDVGVKKKTYKHIKLDPMNV